MNIEDKIKLIVDALEDIKAQDITVIDTGKLTSLFERMVIATGTQPPDARNCDNVRVKMKEARIRGQHGRPKTPATGCCSISAT